MFHNYVVQYPDSAILVSVQTEQTPEFVSVYGVGRLCYSGKHNVYVNNQLQLKEAADFKINTASIVMQYTSENLQHASI